MKSLVKVFVAVCFIFSAFAASAADGDFFLGKWKVMLYGTPNGDAPMEVHFEMKDGKIACLMPNEKGEFKPVDRMEISDSEVTVYWVAAGYNVYLFLEKTGDDKVEGSMMDMFDAKGERIKEEK